MKLRSLAAVALCLAFQCASFAVSIDVKSAVERATFVYSYLRDRSKDVETSPDGRRFFIITRHPSVSRNRSTQPRWSRDGRELFFMEGAARYTWTAAPFQAVQGSAPQIGEPKPLFTFTVVMPGAHELSIASSAASPPKLAP